MKFTILFAGQASTWANVLSAVEGFGASTTTSTAKNEWVEGPSTNSHHRQYVLVKKQSPSFKSHVSNDSLFMSHILQPGCGKDTPYLVLNIRMLPHPLVVCPESIRKLTGLGPQLGSSKGGVIDDSFMYAAAHVIVLRSVDPRGEISFINSA